MPYQLVTCPESANLAMIEYEDPPLGRLIVECSRIGPGRPVTCLRTCAARRDQRARSALAADLAAEGELTPEAELEGDVVTLVRPPPALGGGR